MTNSWSNQACVQGFGCGYILFKKAVNIFEIMDIFESIYKGLEEPSYKKNTRSYANHAGYISIKRVEAA